MRPHIYELLENARVRFDDDCRAAKERRSIFVTAAAAAVTIRQTSEDKKAISVEEGLWIPSRGVSDFK
ncbi:hypothetical protein Trydic_g15038 [Trypoxylus dichotomus]